MSDLRNLLFGNAAPHETGDDGFFRTYGLRHNPFPANRTILPQVLYNQEQAIKRFAQAFRDILSDEPQRRAMAVLAGTGGGKTHFLRHCRWTVEIEFKRRQRHLLFVEFQAGAGKFQDIAREILGAADMLCTSVQELDFVSTLTRRLATSPELIRQVLQDEVRSALTRLLEAAQPEFQPKDRDGVYTFDVLREVFRRWLFGAALSATERKYIGVISRINTASMAVRVVTEILQLARSLSIFEGLVLCLDEIETIFKRFSAAQYQAYLQDLRYLFDEALKHERGYSLFVLSASTTDGAAVLAQVNYPVFQRFGFEPNQRGELSPVGGLDEARRFAAVYIEFERKQFSKRRAGSQPAKYPDLLTPPELEEAYKAALGPVTSSRRDAVALQAPLLDALHSAVDRKREQATMNA